ncbi:MAG: RNase adapter RapZ, partial [Pseudomonadota bacterium]
MNTQRSTPPPPSRSDDGPPATRLVVVSGLSGSGKTVALRTLEDLDHYCVDNLPVALIPAFVDSVTGNQAGRYPRLAVGVDVRSRVEDLALLPDILSRIAADCSPSRKLLHDTLALVRCKLFSDSVLG